MFGNLPNGGYDGAIIMGPYHDLDPSVAPLPVPPNFRCKYDVVGNAPHRRFVFSFFNVPLFSGPCNSLNQNTHQIVLYESTGIVEVFIKDKQLEQKIFIGTGVGLIVASQIAKGFLLKN